jgi:hypothetical protein
MTLNVALTQLITIGESKLTDNVLISIIGIALGLIACYRMGYKITDLVGIRKMNTMTICGYEEKTTYNYPVSMEALSALLIEKYKVSNVLVCPGSKYDVIVGNLTNHKLENDLYMTVTREKASGCVTFVLQSYTTNLDTFVQRSIEKYTKSNYKYCLSLYGKDSSTEYEYPEVMRKVTFTLIHKYGIDKLISKMNPSQDKQMCDKRYEMQDTKYINDIFIIEECKDRQLDPDVYLTVKCTQNIIKYTFVSNTVQLQTFIRECETYYENKINEIKYKYTVTISGREVIVDPYNKESMTQYPDYMYAVNYILIHQYGLNKYRILQDANKNNNYMLDGITHYTFNISDKQGVPLTKYTADAVDTDSTDSSDTGEIILRVTRSALATTYGSSVFGNIDYTLSSNSVNVDDFLRQCKLDYDQYLNIKHKNKIYHFTLTGFVGGKPTFNTETLYDESHPIFETFDNIHNEHVDFLKKDIVRLHDLSYYKRTGLKRKKSYLFYGEPGCGKTSSVVAMSIHDKRHIIDIPFCLLTKNSELEAIMNLGSINDFSFERSQMIYLFDEIDTGITHIRSAMESKDISVAEKKEEEKTHELETAKTLAQPNRLNLGKILSKFDGICNYDGLIIIATTNCKDKLDPALYREMRLTPIYFTYLRTADAVEIIEKFFRVKLTEDQQIQIPDRKFPPAKLVFLCEKYETMPVNEFIQTITCKKTLTSLVKWTLW